MSIFKMSTLAKLSGNAPIQKFLRWNIRISQYLIGNGSGNNCEESGESKLFKILPDYCQEPYTIFDIGANKGQFINLLLDNFSYDNFEIHCFEPCKKPFNYISNKFNDERIKLNNFAISDFKGKGKIYYDKPDSVFASLTKRKSERFGTSLNKSELIEIETIDHYCKDAKINHISLLKIDVEGHELDVLNGAKDMFNNSLIDMVSFEFGAVNVETRTFFIDFWRFFKNANMSLFRISPSGYLTEIKYYNSRELEIFTTAIIIAINNQKLNQ